MKALTGRVFDIQHFCVHDGPGIRTTVFLKGCPLNCRWCHNPESKYAGTELFFHRLRCAGCGACEKICPQHRAHEILNSAVLREQYCHRCLLCARACVYDAIEQIGGDMTVDEVMAELLGDLEYYKYSGGGMTISGGEALMQGEFSLALLKAAAGHTIHTAVETSGFGSRDGLSTLLPYTDLFLWDVKIADKAAHQNYTDSSLECILDNLIFASTMGAKIILRILYIPEISDSHGCLRSLAELIVSLKPVGWEVIPYHRMGSSKLEKLGLTEQYCFREPDEDEIKEFESKIFAASKGCSCN
jgi:pyruvate formate lyase activating enzyme